MPCASLPSCHLLSLSCASETSFLKHTLFGLPFTCSSVIYSPHLLHFSFVTLSKFITKCVFPARRQVPWRQSGCLGLLTVSFVIGREFAVFILNSKWIKERIRDGACPCAAYILQSHIQVHTYKEGEGWRKEGAQRRDLSKSRHLIWPLEEGLAFQMKKSQDQTLDPSEHNLLSRLLWSIILI